MKLLLLIPDLIIIPLAYILNLSLQSDIYPNLLVLVKVVPTHKILIIIEQFHCDLFLIKLSKN